jgi:hypothetical protein
MDTILIALLHDDIRIYFLGYGRTTILYIC